MSEDPNPYEVLGVRRNATDRTIRDAYRKLSKVHHPDAGGKTEQFAALVAAQQILTDAPRRAWYDEHGYDRGPAEVIRGRAMTALSAHVQAVLMADQEPTGNLVQHMRRVVEGQLHKQRTEAMVNHDKVLARLKKIEGRFHTKKNAENAFTAIIEGHRREVEKSRRGLELGILVNEEVLRILEEYDYEEERIQHFINPVAQRGSHYYSRFISTTAGTS